MSHPRTGSQPAPWKLKTDLCTFFASAQGCQRGSDCWFAHGAHELREPLVLKVGRCLRLPLPLPLPVWRLSHPSVSPTLHLHVLRVLLMCRQPASVRCPTQQDWRRMWRAS